MFLSAGVLTDEERETAFAAVPEMRALQLNWSTALNLTRGGLLERLDAIVAGFLREALAAHLDGSLLLMRAAGSIAESRAAELFCARAEPAPWLTVPQGLNQELRQDERLRPSGLPPPGELPSSTVLAANPPSLRCAGFGGDNEET